MDSFHTNMHRFLIVIGCAILGACSGKPAPGPSAAEGALQSSTAPLDDTVTVQLSQRAMTRDRSVQLTYVKLVSESRCPANAICVWQGDAAVQLKAETIGATVDTTIHTALDPKVIAIGANQISLLEVQPYPGTGASPTPGYIVARIIRH
jgi:hypothetical protein